MDGNHRLYAAAITGMNQIKYHIKGSESFLKLYKKVTKIKNAPQKKEKMGNFHLLLYTFF